MLRNATQVERLRQDRLALNLDRDRDLDPDRKFNDLEKEWNMDAQDGQDLDLTLAESAKQRKEGEAPKGVN